MPDAARARALLRGAVGRPALTEDAAKEVLACFGLRVPRRVVLPLKGMLGTTLTSFTPPFVLKVVAPDILHKSDLGGVRVGIADAAALEVEIGRMAARVAGHAVEGWLIEEMAPPGVEMVIGGGVDARFGPHVMVGFGGVMVELLEDVRFGLCPLRPRDVRRMLEQLRGVRLLRGWRRAAPSDEEALIEAVMQVGGADGLMMALADTVAELDVNPLIVGASGAIAVDARIVLQSDRG